MTPEETADAIVAAALELAGKAPNLGMYTADAMLGLYRGELKRGITAALRSAMADARREAFDEAEAALRAAADVLDNAERHAAADFVARYAARRDEGGCDHKWNAPPFDTVCARCGAQRSREGT